MVGRQWSVVAVLLAIDRCVSKTTVLHVIHVRGTHLLALIADKTHLFAYLGRHLSFEAAFAQKAVNSLHFVPSLLGGYLREVGGSLFGPALSYELYSNAMDTNLPIEIVLAILKFAKDRHSHFEMR